MPFKSEKQRRFMYWAEAHNKVPKGTAKKWEEHTPKDVKLPERVGEKNASAFEEGFEKNAFWGSIVGAAAKAGRSITNAGINLAGRGRTGNWVGGKMQRTGRWITANPETASVGAGMGLAGLGAGYMMGKTSAFEQGFEKKAGIAGNILKNVEEHGLHPAELAGLGILAVPAAKHLATGKPMGEKAKDVYDVTGLGVLAAPSAAHYLRKVIK